MLAHQEADRVPITDGPWNSTLERWHREGLPAGMHFADYFGLDLWNTQLTTQLTLLDWVWEQDFHFDAIEWPDDMGYKGHQFFSLPMYRELLRPVHQRACDWARAHGIAVRLHSCGLS